jgi:hypothetical protein
MKKCITLFAIFLLGLTSCQSQTKKNKEVVKENQKEKTEIPKGSWRVDKQFDENGNLIRYDSVYTWSSNDTINNLSLLDKDSLLSNFESKFYSRFSKFKSQGYEDIFGKDSLFGNYFFNKNFFNSDFGIDFMNLHKIHKQMIERQKKFLDKYRSDFYNIEKDSL